MKKRIQKYLAGEREGFSLVELIIVIAIMAILIGVVALAVLPNIQRSRESKDIQALDSIASAANAAIATTQATGSGAFSIGTTTGGVVDQANPGSDEQKKIQHAIFQTVATGAGKVESDSAKKGTNIVLSYNVSTKTIEVAYSKKTNSVADADCAVAEYLSDSNGKQKFKVTNNGGTSATS